MSFTSAACRNFSSSTCGIGGLWEPGLNSGNQTPFRWQTRWTDSRYGIQVENATSMILAMTVNKTTMWNATLSSASSGNIAYPGGQVGPVTLGSLALGGGQPYQVFFTLYLSGDEMNAYTFSGQLYLEKRILSYSYGLHVGSAAFNYPGSLVFRGYNKGRVVDPIYSFTDKDTVNLLDTTIGGASGTSPFNFTNKENFLSAPQDAVLNPPNPYLALPSQTCKDLADVLPVVFDPVLKYYLWNTSHPNFEKIMTSGNYLGFQFPENLLIKVPFVLLNLTLDTPITNTPVQYFPRVTYGSDTPPIVIGRAFLQAAFIGRNWNMKTSWLAQAHGPGIGQVVSNQVRRQGLGEGNVDIADNAVKIEGHTEDWFLESWEGQWSLEESLKGSGMNGSQSSSNITFSTNGGLSAGAKAGIGVGVALGVIAILAGLFFTWKWLQSKRASQDHQQKKFPENHDIQEASSDSKPMVELSQGPRYLAAELAHPQQYAEMPYTQQSPVELSGAEARNT